MIPEANVKKASELLDRLVAARRHRDTVRNATHFKLEFREQGQPFGYLTEAPVNANDYGSYGDLASRLHDAAIAYVDFHHAELVKELRALGVKVEEEVR